MVAQATSFADFRLQPVTRAAIAQMGISVPTPIQLLAIPALLDGRDVVGQAQTGSGKTLAYALPIVERCAPKIPAVQALVLVPTRELAVQVGGVLRLLAVPRRLRVTLLYGGRSLVTERQALANGAQVVVGTPGRTLDHLRQGSLLLDKLRICVLDEGDEMLDRGFAPDIERILSHTPAMRQTALFSATIPAWVKSTAARHLQDPVTIRIDRETESPPEIQHVVYEVDTGAKFTALRTLLDRRGDGQILVFGRTKHGVKKLARRLAELGYPVSALQGNLSQNVRNRVMTDFRSGAVPILLATNVAARGLDVAGIQQVINYELPETAQLFTHRVGRTGRMGQPGEAITLITPEETPKWRQIEKTLGHSLPRRPWPANGAKMSPGHKSPSPIKTRMDRPTNVAGGSHQPAVSPARPAAATRRGPRSASYRRPEQTVPARHK